MVNDVRQREIHTAKLVVLERSAFDSEVAIEKLKRHKSPDIDKILAEMIKSGCRTIISEVSKLMNSVWNMEEVTEHWKESVIVPMYRKGDKMDCSNYKGISLFSATYKILSNILLSRLTPYAEEIIRDRQCGF